MLYSSSTFTDGIVVEVGFALVACETVECVSTVALTSLLLTGHAVRTRVVTVTRYTQTDRRTTVTLHYPSHRQTDRQTDHGNTALPVTQTDRQTDRPR